MAGCTSVCTYPSPPASSYWDLTMTDLDSVKASLRNFRKVTKKTEKQEYLNTPADIGATYDKMTEDKELINNYRRKVKTFFKKISKILDILKK